MANNSNGQNSYLILDSLANGSKYGLEIIEYISQKTGGTIILKKPSLYSSLTRMEKKGQISSSYWGESDLGGKRHYYTITNAGKRELELLAKEFADYDFGSTEVEEKDDGVFLPPQEKPVIEENSAVEVAPAPVFLQQDNLFDQTKLQQTYEEEEQIENDVLENQIDIFSMPLQNAQQDIEITDQTNASTKDDGKFLEADEKLSDYQTNQNKIIYDTSSELKKYRKRKSFSENQIEMAVVYERDEDRQIQRERIEQLKASMLEARKNNKVELHSHENDNSNNQTQIPHQTSEDISTDKEKKDDGVLITNPPIDHSQIPVQKKISPTNIEVNIYDDDLPAPKRDSDLEPTYKDMMAKLFERKKENPQSIETEELEIQQTQEDSIGSFTDYSDLKRYYASHNIDFKEYRKTTIKRKHNTNLINFVASCLLLLLSGIGSAIVYWIVSAMGKLSPSTNFLYYTLPIGFAVYMIYSLIKLKISTSRRPVLIYNSIVNWAVALLGIAIVFVINIACGMQFETISSYLTSLLLPIWSLLLIFPINFYAKKIGYKKFGK